VHARDTQRLHEGSGVTFGGVQIGEGQWYDVGVHTLILIARPFRRILQLPSSDKGAGDTAAAVLLSLAAAWGARATANQAFWADIETVFGYRGEPARCWCQWFTHPEPGGFSNHPARKAERAARLREQTRAGQPDADTTAGLVAYEGGGPVSGEPVGWAAVAPRPAYLSRLVTQRVPWAGRDEDQRDPGVWAVTCFVTRKGYRRRGVARALAAAAADHARSRGATAVEGYALEAPSGSSWASAQLYVGSRSMFEAAGFREVSRPTPRRVVMRVDY
jgi:GNAT superfamily N-acetyltransferase